MELLWIVFITFLAVTAAYYAGGYLDRRARARQQQEEGRRREEYLARVEGFAGGFAGLIVRRGLADKKALPEIACLLSRYLEKYSEEQYTPEEWEQLCARLHALQEK